MEMFDNPLSLYVKSMGKIFRVRYIASSDEEANRFCEKHRDTGIIAEHREKNMILIADLYQIKVPSSVLPD